MRFRSRLISALLALPMVFGAGAGAAYQTFTATASDASAGSAVMDLDQAVEYLRSQMKARNTDIVLTLSGSFSSTDEAVGYAYWLLDLAVEETDDPLEGDYIRYSIEDYNVAVWDIYPTQATMGFYFSYFADAEQENEAVDTMYSALEGLDLAYNSDYDMLYDIYTYVAGVSNYGDIEDPIQHSSYGTVVNHWSVCQGYALTMYYMLRQAGFQARIVVGNGNGGAHAWNIVELEGKYYYLDCTWDSENTEYITYDYFLRGTEDFDSVRGTEHTYDLPSYGQYITAPDWSELIKQYPMAQYTYASAEASYTFGDANGDGLIDGADASLILVINAGGSDPGFIAEAADVDGNGMIDGVDASLILSYNAFAVSNAGVSLEDYLKDTSKNPF